MGRPVQCIYELFCPFLSRYNVFAHYNEDRGCCLRLLSPLVLLAYPLWIVPVTLALGLYGAGAQGPIV